MTKRAFTIVELLLTVALIGVSVGVLIVGYGNLRSIVQDTTQNRDQQVMYQAVATFNLMGGDMSPVFNSGLNKDEQAAVLTRVMQGSASAAVRKQKGEVSDLVAEDMVVVPMSSDTGMALLLPSPDINPNTVRLVITVPGKKVDGFVVVSKDSPLGGQSLAVDWNMSKDSATRINGVVQKILGNNNISGARYADNRANRVGAKYVWNDDETARDGPGDNLYPTGPGAPIPTPTRLKYKSFYDSSLTYAEYTKPDEASGKGLKLLQFYREDNGPLSANEIDITQITFGGRALNSDGMRVVQSTGEKSNQVVNVYITLDKILPANEWTQDSVSLVVKVKPTSIGKKGAKDRAPLTGDINDQLLINAKKEPLQTVKFEATTDGPLKVDDYVEITPQDVKTLPSGWVGVSLDGTPNLESGNIFDNFFGLFGDGSPLIKLIRNK